MGDGIGDFAFWLAIGLAGLGLTFGPIGTAVARWIESKSHHGPRELDEAVSSRLAEVDAMAHRLMELEERVDFTERMLVEARKPALVGADPPPVPDTPPEPAGAVRG